MPFLRIADLDQTDGEAQSLIQDLGRRYEQFLDEEEEQEGMWNRPPGIHASEISKCGRQAYYTLIGTKKVKSTPRIWRWKFRHGTWIHEGLQRDFHRMARQSQGLIEFQDEVKITPYTSAVSARYRIQSSTDGIFLLRKRLPDREWPIDYARVVLEIKSSSHAEFEKRKAPQPEHIEQANLYMRCLDAPFAWLLYFDKDKESYTPPMGNFVIQYNPVVWSAVEERLCEWFSFLGSDGLPVQQEGIGCTWCPYAWTCKPKTRQRTFAAAPPPFANIRCTRR